jgi:hypothetical protein
MAGAGPRGMTLMRGAWKEAHEPTIASIFLFFEDELCFRRRSAIAPPRELIAARLEKPL